MASQQQTPASEFPEVLLPDTSVTNGDVENDDAENYLDEDPMSEDVDESHRDEENAIGEEDTALDTLDETAKDNAQSESSTNVANNTTVLPKKRKSEAVLSAGSRQTTPSPTAEEQETAEEKEIAEEQETTEETDQPTEVSKSETKDDEVESASTSRAAASKVENQVDEEQCRVCTTKVDLVSLFKEMEKRQTIADMLMTICPSVSIALKDFMPQFICNPCLDNVTIALQLKTQCETTERELRKKLSRSKNKVRRPMGYVTIDATIDSDPPSDEEPNDDVEFKVSDEASASADDDSEDSDFSEKRRSPRGGGGGGGGGGARRGRRKQAVTPGPKSKKQKFIKREHEELESDDDDGNGSRMKNRKKSTNSESPVAEFPCDECDQVFHRKLSLVLHKKVHSNDRASFNCGICGRQFKIQGAYRSHMQKHKEESQGHACEKCDEMYATKADLKRHLSEDHNEQGMVYTCKKCQRTFVTLTRLEKHITRCPGFSMNKKRTEYDGGHVVGQDLFKAVAPLTTTYWSDSFSD